MKQVPAVTSQRADLSLSDSCSVPPSMQLFVKMHKKQTETIDRLPDLNEAVLPSLLKGDRQNQVTPSDRPTPFPSQIGDAYVTTLLLGQH